MNPWAVKGHYDFGEGDSVSKTYFAILQLGEVSTILQGTKAHSHNYDKHNYQLLYSPSQDQ
ncbi:unnamed protein product [marine sediment metagenome]|uniref:Uncharacterized protein n=1 Tax=marine sediment metagenome TaxID=412755 RepID=X1HKA2_9ZZZZ